MEIDEEVLIDGDVRAALEDARDHARARRARAHLEEEAHALLVRPLNELGEVEAPHRLLENAVGRGLTGHVVDVSRRGAEEADAGRSRRRKEVEVVILLGHGLCHRAVHRGHALERVEVAVQRVHYGRYTPAVSSDHAFRRRVDDEEIDPFFCVEHASHRPGRAMLALSSIGIVMLGGTGIFYLLTLFG